jgi:hypothetical protein
MISIELSPEYLQEALNAIKADHDDAEVTFADGSTTAGHVHTSQIDADFEYRQRNDNEGTLVFTNEAKHGLYKFVSDATIGEHINALLTQLPTPADVIARKKAEADAKIQTKDAEADAQLAENVDALNQGQALDTDGK